MCRLAEYAAIIFDKVKRRASRPPAKQNALQRPALRSEISLLSLLSSFPSVYKNWDKQINVILSAEKDQFARKDGCKSLKSFHVA